jgi:hypothetical protein
VVADAVDELADLSGGLAVGGRDQHVAAGEREPLHLDDGEVGLREDVSAEQDGGAEPARLRHGRARRRCLQDGIGGAQAVGADVGTTVGDQGANDL